MVQPVRAAGAAPVTRSSYVPGPSPGSYIPPTVASLPTSSSLRNVPMSHRDGAKVFPEVRKFDTRPTTNREKPRISDSPACNLIPGDCECAIALTADGKLLIKGPPQLAKRILSVFRKKGGSEDDDVEYLERTSSGRLLALDFDKTLAQVFLWAELGGNQGEQAQMRALSQWAIDGRLLDAFGGEARVRKISRVLSARRDMGDQLCVLSSCSVGIINAALRVVKLDDLLPPEFVYGSDTSPFGLSKAVRINRLLDIHRLKHGTLVDDDIGHCRASQGAGHDVIWVRLGKGMQDRELGQLERGEWDRDL